jgi:hypothetical protein
MQEILRWISIALFLALSLFMLWFGYVYASVTDMLWFHGAALPTELHPQVLPLYLALMNLIGSSSFVVGLLTAYVALIPLRRGAPWAAAALFGAFTIVFAMAAITAEELAASTGAPTSWHIMGVLFAVAAAGYSTHVVAQRLRPPASQLDTARVGA